MRTVVHLVFSGFGSVCEESPGRAVNWTAYNGSQSQVSGLRSIQICVESGSKVWEFKASTPRQGIPSSPCGRDAQCLDRVQFRPGRERKGTEEALMLAEAREGS